MKFCDYDCGREAKYRFKNGKWCCSKSYQSCPNMSHKMSRGKGRKCPWLVGRNKRKDIREKISEKLKGRKIWEEAGWSQHPSIGRVPSKKERMKMSKAQKKRFEDPEERRKQKLSLKGKVHTQEHIRKRIESRRNNGKPWQSEETIRKMAETRTGVPLGPMDDYHKKKISKAKMGWIPSDETIENMKKAKRKFFGTTYIKGMLDKVIVEKLSRGELEEITSNLARMKRTPHYKYATFHLFAYFQWGKEYCECDCGCQRTLLDEKLYSKQRLSMHNIPGKDRICRYDLTNPDEWQTVCNKCHCGCLGQMESSHISWKDGFFKQKMEKLTQLLTGDDGNDSGDAKEETKHE